MKAFLSRPLLALALVLVSLASVGAAAVAVAPDRTPAERAATIAARAGSAVLLDVAQAGARLVAVGERGLVLLSDDAGKTWRQTASPTSVTLTAVRFASPLRGWATGHAGTILATDDGGEHWRRQLDGRAVAASTLQQARRELAAADALPASVASAAKDAALKAVAEAERLVADGPDKPFFDIWFADEQHGFAVGAYNLFVRTEDGGATWTAVPGRLPNAKGNHLYAISGSGSSLYIVGEQGLLLRSTDGGKRFEALKSPYAGSFFTLALLPGGELVAAGLRGNAFRSADQGSTWQAIQALPPVTWIASAVSPDKSVWLGNQAGQVYTSDDTGLSWTPAPPPSGQAAAPLTSLLAIEPGQVLTTTLRGFGRATRASSASGPSR